MNDRWLACILIFFFLTYIFGTYTFDTDLWLFVQMALISALVITTSLIINLILHYRTKSREFTISYIFLAVSIGSYAVAEILWGYFDSVGIDTYPSIAEIFYISYFINGILFCITFIWDKKHCIPLYIKAVGILFAVIIFSSYLILSQNNLTSEVFGISTFMMGLSSILIGSAVTASLIISKNPKLKKVWIMYGVAFVGNSIVDIFYYSGENAGMFQYTDWANIMWFGTILLIFYGGFMHNYLYRKL